MNFPKKTEIITSDWQQSLRSALKNARDIAAFFNCDEISSYPSFIPLHFAQKIKQAGRDSALWKQFVPSGEEVDDIQEEGLIDPIGDALHQKAAQIIHRYDNRVLFFPTTFCPIICRYCFRKNELDLSQFEGDLFKPDLSATLQYLINHPEIEEVIFSGGDPLVLSDEKITHYLALFSDIPSIKFIRFHTRTPIILPERITPTFVGLLHKFKERFDINLAIHCNHVDELDGEVISAIQSLQNGPNLLSQTVLLKGVNDHEMSLNSLMRKLYELKVRPYYLHHPDRVRGGMHFYLSEQEGFTLYQKLRRMLPGHLLPQYVVDHPEGLGKRPVLSF